MSRRGAPRALAVAVVVAVTLGLGLATAVLLRGEPAGTGAIARPSDGMQAVTPGPSAPRLLVVHGGTIAELRERLESALGVERAAALDLDRTRIGGSPRATALAVQALPDGELDALAEELDELAVRLEARRHPLAVDLGQGEPGDELLARLERWLPTLSAARALAADRWLAPDRSLVVVPSATCPGALTAGASCVPAWPPAAPSREEQRVRFVAWPLTTAAWLRWATELGAARALDVLRRSAAAGGPVALVVGRPRDPARQARLRTVGEAAARAARGVAGWRSRRARPVEALLREVADGVDADASLPWLSLGPTEALVVPRLGELGRIDGFVAEVERVLAAAGLPPETPWLARPRPL